MVTSPSNQARARRRLSQGQVAGVIIVAVAVVIVLAGVFGLSWALQ